MNSPASTRRLSPVAELVVKDWICFAIATKARFAMMYLAAGFPSFVAHRFLHAARGVIDNAEGDTLLCRLQRWNDNCDDRRE
jgi:hypothetical protein